MTAALEGVSGQQHARAALYRRQRPGTDFTGGWVGFRAIWTADNLVSTGIRSRTVQPVVSRYTDWATVPATSKKDGNKLTKVDAEPLFATQLPGTVNIFLQGMKFVNAVWLQKVVKH